MSGTAARMLSKHLRVASVVRSWPASLKERAQERAQKGGESRGDLKPKDDRERLSFLLE